MNNQQEPAPTPAGEWRVESVLDEYSAAEPIVYTVVRLNDITNGFWFRDEREANKVCDYLNNAASRLRIAEDALDAAAALGAFVGDIRESNDCGYFNSEDHSEPGETMYLALRRTLAAFMGVDDDEAVWDENYDARHRPQGKQP